MGWRVWGSNPRRGKIFFSASSVRVAVSSTHLFFECQELFP